MKKVRVHVGTIGLGMTTLTAAILMVMQGDNAAIGVGLDKPAARIVGSHFAIREGGKTDGPGVITKVAEKPCSGVEPSIPTYHFDL